MLVNAHYEKHVEQLIGLAGRFASALSEAGIEYRIVGETHPNVHERDGERYRESLTEL